MKKLILLLLFIPLVSFGQTKKIDELRTIWLNEMFEYDVTIKDIDWSETFTPYYTSRHNLPKLIKSFEEGFSETLTRIGLNISDYYFSSDKRFSRGRYWIEYDAWEKFMIIDSKNNNEVVGIINFYRKASSYKNYKKEFDKYNKKNKVDKIRIKSNFSFIWEEVLKRYRK